MTVYDFEMHDWQIGQNFRFQTPAQVQSMPENVRRAFEDKQAEYVFGVGFQRDPKTGEPVERGIGSISNMTAAAKAALAKAGATKDDLKVKAGI